MSTGKLTADEGSYSIKDPVFTRAYWCLRRTVIKCLSWEYWPFHMVYGPMYFYWVWLGIRAGSFFFFSAANPRIRNSGFVHEKKSDIYKLMPPDFYPKTSLCKQSISFKDLCLLIKDEKFDYPLIVKPDIGERGIGVKLVGTKDELYNYWIEARVDFLVQEYIDFEHEIGVFYFRIPGEKRGQISGIAGKEFLTVTGDGKSSIETLIKKGNRSILQLMVLRATYRGFLHTILPEGLKFKLVPYGNHRAGTKFTDLDHRITEELNYFIDSICLQIPGFYFGRMDIKFKNWEDLVQGKNFCIIELNGAGSEPAHMYDPGHSIFFAWKEIRRHWYLLYKISKLNSEREKISLMGLPEGVKMIKEHARYMKRIS